MGEFEWDIRMETMLNPYEVQQIKIKGEAYQESIQFEKLPFGKEDAILFGDVIIDKPKKVKFELRNTSNDTIRFSWNNLANPDFEFFPELGPLSPGESKPIRVFLKS